MKKQRSILPYLAAAGASLAWGFSFLFTKGALGSLAPMQLLGCRFGMAALAMSLLIIPGYIKLSNIKGKLKDLALISLINPIAYFLCETNGVKLTTATVSGVVLGLVPVAIMLFSALLLRERLTVLKWVTVGVCVAGVALIALSNGTGAGGGSLLGVVMLLGAVATAGLYTPVSRSISTRCSPLEITFAMMWMGAVVFNIAGLATHQGSVGAYFGAMMNTDVLLRVAFLAIVCSVLAFVCFNYSVSKLESTVTGTFINLVPLVSMFAGLCVGGDRLAPLQITGAVLVLAGIWGTAWGRGKAAPATLPDNAG